MNRIAFPPDWDKNVPRTPLNFAPSPLHSLDRVRENLGGAAKCPRLFIKRDDLNGVAFGGNKIRKLEYLLGDALAQSCDTLITAGATQSNHCRQTAGVAVMMQMEAHLCLRSPEPQPHSGNVILDDWLGARLHFAPLGSNVSQLMPVISDELRAKGRKPYLIPIGGSNGVGTVGIVTAFQEIVETVPDVDYIVAATGSGGTHAGLQIGARLVGDTVKIIGVGVSEADTVSWNVDVCNLANAAVERLGLSEQFAPQHIDCPMDWLGEKYGVPTTAGMQAIQYLARTEGIFLDPVYSGKAFAGLLDMIRAGRFAPSETIVFYHTGGSPTLFVESYRQHMPIN